MKCIHFNELIFWMRVYLWLEVYACTLPILHIAHTRSIRTNNDQIIFLRQCNMKWQWVSHMKFSFISLLLFDWVDHWQRAEAIISKTCIIYSKHIIQIGNWKYDRRYQNVKTRWEKTHPCTVYTVQGKWRKIHGQAIINCNDFVQFPQQNRPMRATEWKWNGEKKKFSLSWHSNVRSLFKGRSIHPARETKKSWSN